MYYIWHEENVSEDHANVQMPPLLPDHEIGNTGVISKSGRYTATWEGESATMDLVDMGIEIDGDYVYEASNGTLNTYADPQGPPYGTFHLKAVVEPEEDATGTYEWRCTNASLGYFSDDSGPEATYVLTKLITSDLGDITELDFICNFTAEGTDDAGQTLELTEGRSLYVYEPPVDLEDANIEIVPTVEYNYIDDNTLSYKITMRESGLDWTASQVGTGYNWTVQTNFDSSGFFPNGAYTWSTTRNANAWTAGDGKVWTSQPITITRPSGGNDPVPTMIVHRLILTKTYGSNTINGDVMVPVTIRWDGWKGDGAYTHADTIKNDVELPLGRVREAGRRVPVPEQWVGGATGV
jgi:hypothetical protein